jgi:hypothetical protein
VDINHHDLNHTQKRESLYIQIFKSQYSRISVSSRSIVLRLQLLNLHCQISCHFVGSPTIQPMRGSRQPRLGRNPQRSCPGWAGPLATPPRSLRNLKLPGKEIIVREYQHLRRDPPGSCGYGRDKAKFREAYPMAPQGMVKYVGGATARTARQRSALRNRNPPASLRYQNSIMGIIHNDPTTQSLVRSLESIIQSISVGPDNPHCLVRQPTVSFSPSNPLVELTVMIDIVSSRCT